MGLSIIRRIKITNDIDILKLSNLAKSIGLEVLIEIHEIEELKKSSIVDTHKMA